jgi:hypothetical protein
MRTNGVINNKWSRGFFVYVINTETFFWLSNKSKLTNSTVRVYNKPPPNKSWCLYTGRLILIKIKFAVHKNGVQSLKFKFPKTLNTPILTMFGFQNYWLHYIFHMKAHTSHQETNYAKLNFIMAQLTTKEETKLYSLQTCSAFLH